MSDSTAAIIAAFIAAGSALWIGWLQVNALSHQNRIAAFNLRNAVFSNALEAIELALHQPDKIITATDKMREALRASWFLFPKSVSDELQRALEDLHAIQTEQVIKNPSDQITKEALEGAKATIRRIGTLRETFHPHLHLSN